MTTLRLPRLLQMPRFVRYGIRIDTAPEWLWLMLLAAALWPTWWWMGQRMVDGSDDPLGLLALTALTVVVWLHRHVLRPSPRLGWLSLALAGAVAATATRAHLPDLASALIALLSLAAGLAAFLPARVATAPVIGLSVLSLPLLASLQFYAGYPLRVVTAEISRWLLALGHEVTRSGSSLLVNGHLVIVDAPCSGVQMVWMAYFCACAVAALTALRDGDFLKRLPAIGALVLVGNVLRNSLLVALESRPQGLDADIHQAIGLVVLAMVCAAVAVTMKGARHDDLA